MAEKKNEIAEQKQPTFEMVLTEGLNANKEFLPANFNIPKFVQNCVALIKGNDPLMNYAKNYGSASIKACLMQAAFMGLDAFNQECYVVPYGKNANFMISAKGARKLIEMYSVKPVVSVGAEIVKANDEFDYWEEDGEQHYKFHAAKSNRGVVIKAFAVVRYADKSIKLEVMSIDDLEAVRKTSKQSQGMAWKSFTEEMYKKTVIHRLAKNVSLNFDNPNQKAIFDDDCAINTENGKYQEEYHDFNDIPQAEEVVVESTVIDEDVDLPDFMKG